MEYLIIFVLAFYVTIEIINIHRIYYSSSEEGPHLMSKNDAAVIVVLKDIDKSKDIYYVGHLFNPQSSLAKTEYFTDFIFKSECYEAREKAVDRAKFLDKEQKTEYGVLVYDGMQDLTFGEAISKFNSKRYVS